MKILIGGASGFIGAQLVKKLKFDGHNIDTISRDPQKGSYNWEEVKDLDFSDYDAVINLSGARVVHRWTNEYKNELIDSRINTTEILVRGIERAKKKPKVWISASAVGWYPPGQERIYDESAPKAGDGFLAQLCDLWEKTTKLNNTDTRSVIIRIGLVLGPNGGMLKKLLTPFKLGFGGVIGSGEEYFPWIHIKDLTRLFSFCLNENVKGVINAVSPHVITNRIFCKSLAKALKCPLFIKIPPFLVKIIYGERASLFLDKAAIIPKVALDLKFQYEYPAIDAAIIDCLEDKS